jgi:hypothetical protein
MGRTLAKQTPPRLTAMSEPLQPDAFMHQPHLDMKSYSFIDLVGCATLSP